VIIKCSHCGKEFDSPGRRNQHEKDAHSKSCGCLFCQAKEAKRIGMDEETFVTLLEQNDIGDIEP
jgi:hypothetical protein